jgi:hypothetical protein
MIFLIGAGVWNPIPFRAHRDIRTLTHFAGFIDVKRSGVAHDAIDDCIYQAKYITKGFKHLAHPYYEDADSM